MYNKILIPLDFHGDNSEIIEKAQAIAKTNDAEMFLIHVNETLAVAYAVDGLSWNDQIVNLDASIRKEAQKRMSEIASSLSIPEENCFNRDGRPAAEIHELAKEKDIDLIIMGTHGQSGLQLLLGSTANGVLHGSTCDVLTIRIGD